MHLLSRQLFMHIALITKASSAHLLVHVLADARQNDLPEVHLKVLIAHEVAQLDLVQLSW